MEGVLTLSLFGELELKLSCADGQNPAPPVFRCAFFRFGHRCDFEVALSEPIPGVS